MRDKSNQLLLYSVFGEAPRSARHTRLFATTLFFSSLWPRAFSAGGSLWRRSCMMQQSSSRELGGRSEHFGLGDSTVRRLSLFRIYNGVERLGGLTRRCAKKLEISSKFRTNSRTKLWSLPSLWARSSERINPCSHSWRITKVSSSPGELGIMPWSRGHGNFRVRQTRLASRPLALQPSKKSTPSFKAAMPSIWVTLSVYKKSKEPFKNPCVSRIVSLRRHVKQIPITRMRSSLYDNKLTSFLTSSRWPRERLRPPRHQWYQRRLSEW